MNPIALYLASGESLYTGALLLLITLASSLYIKNKSLVRLRNLAAWTSLAMMLLACPPFPTFIYILFILAFLAWFVAWNHSSHTRRWRNARLVTALILANLAVLLPAIEARHRALPTIRAAPHARLVVLGDSISAGIDDSDPWPALLQKQTSIQVKNLSRPAIGVREAIDIASDDTPDDTLVLLEIGGNDLLSDLPAAEFENQLSQLLNRLAAPNRTLIMFELPLIPHKIGYGRAQRRLAQKHNVHLIPKRYFIHVLTGADATSDGLHLSPTGAQRMANLVAKLFRKP